MILYFLHDKAHSSTDPIKFPTLRSLDKAPLFSKNQRECRTSTLCLCFWFIKTVNMYPYLVPTSDQSMAELFARKIPKADGTASEDYFINENLISMFHFLVACSLDAGATARRNRKVYVRHRLRTTRPQQRQALIGEDLKNILEKWASEFKELTNKH